MIRRLIYGLFWLLGAASCAYLVTEVPKIIYPTHFEYVCRELEIMYPEASCRGLDEPLIIYSNIIGDASGWQWWYGVYYKGEPYIFINPNNLDSKQQEVIRHEMVHYVIWHLDLPPSM